MKGRVIMESKVSVIGQRIYDLRVEKNIQQGELAKAVHIHQSVLNRIERGTRPARDTEIRDIAIYLGVSADMLLAIPVASAKKNPASQEVSPSEFALIEKYRVLDARGKCAVEDTANREYRYVV